jgi:hypothetical protein
MMCLIQLPLWYSWQLLFAPLYGMIMVAVLLDQLQDETATLLADCITAGVAEAVLVICGWRHQAFVALGGTYSEGDEVCQYMRS